MSATSGIGVSLELATLFANANTTDNTRFIKVSIINESLVHDLTIPVNSTFENDLELLQDVLQPNIPAYILAKIAPSDWVAICYVPDSAHVRNKMLYASTRTSLLKSLGSTLFTDTIFATSTADLTSEAYASHKRHIAAPKPLSTREQEMANIQTAESGGVYEGSRTRVNHIGTGVGLHWSPEVENAIRDLGTGDRCAIVLMKIDPKSETLVLESKSEITVEALSSCFPPSEPCYAFFGWPHAYKSSPRREIIFIYSCPSTSPIKYRMVYSSGASSVYTAAKSLLLSSNADIASRKIETSDPAELNESYLRAELGFRADLNDPGQSIDEDEKKMFAKPRKPTKRH